MSKRERERDIRNGVLMDGFEAGVVDGAAGPALEVHLAEHVERAVLGAGVVLACLVGVVDAVGLGPAGIGAALKDDRVAVVAGGHDAVLGRPQQRHERQQLRGDCHDRPWRLLGRRRVHDGDGRVVRGVGQRVA